MAIIRWRWAMVPFWFHPVSNTKWQVRPQQVAIAVERERPVITGSTGSAGELEPDTRAGVSAPQDEPEPVTFTVPAIPGWSAQT